jgi:ketosteroid isomerase-like protein
MANRADDAEIRELITNWAAAARTKNMDGVLARHSDDIVMFDVPLPIVSRGLEQYKATWSLFFANSPGGADSFEITDLQIAAGGTIAYCHALVKVFDSTARLTAGLRKDNGRWVIAHEHHSYALAPKE